MLLGDVFRFIRDWIDFNPYAVPALAFWLVSAVICYCLMLVRNSIEKRNTDLGAIWLHRASRVLLITSTIFLAVSLMPESVMQTIEADYHTLARQTGLERDYPARWKTDTGDLATVRMDGSRIRIDVTNPGSGQGAGFNQAETEKRQGVYAGIAKASRPCETGKASPGRAAALCTEEAPIELTLVTASRIEGRVGAFRITSRTACPNCPPKPSPAWRRFVWTPE